MTEPSPDILERLRRAMGSGLEDAGRVADGLGDVLTKASVVGIFDARWLIREIPPTLRSLFIAECEPADADQITWRLKTQTRRRMLKTLLDGDEAMLRAVLDEVRPPAGDLAGQALQLLLRGAPLSRDPNQLAATLEAASWINTVVPTAVDLRAVRRELSRSRLAHQLDELAARFVGRSDELEQLRAFATGRRSRDTPEIRVLSISGIGGIGKSALLSLIRRDGLAASEAAAGGPIYVHIDFDRFGMAGATGAEWTGELTRHLAFAVPNLAAALDDARKFVNAQSDTADFPSEMLEANVFVNADLLAEVQRILPVDMLRRPLILTFDTVEALQVEGGFGLVRLGDWLRDLHSKGGFEDIRVVLSGCVTASLGDVSQEQQIELGELSDDEAAELLDHLSVDSDAARTVVSTFGGNPLVLRLVAQLARRSAVPINELTRDIGRSAADRELLQGVLYSRILEHINDEMVRKLAHPGLALRRVTEDLLRRVMAPICLGRAVDKTEAQRLMAALSGEVWLIEAAPDGDGVIQRADLRRLMMRLIAADPDELERSLRIHRAGATYYETEGANLSYAQGEALYHRLMLEDPPTIARLADDSIDKLLSAAIGPSVDELPEVSRAAVRVALGGAVPPKLADRLPDALYVRWLDRAAAELVERDLFAEAVALSEWRIVHPQETRDTALPNWRHRALDALCRFDALAAGAGEAGMGAVQTRLEAAAKGGYLAPSDAAELADSLPLTPRYGAEEVRTFHLAVRAGVTSGAGFLERAVGSSSGAESLAKLVPSDALASDYTLAHEFARLLAAIGRPEGLRFRPVRTQLYPSLQWLNELIDAAGPTLSAALAPVRHTLLDGETTIARLLGSVSRQFQNAFAQPFAADAIPEAVFARLIAIDDRPEIRWPARAAVLDAFPATEDLEALAAELRGRLLFVPRDLSEGEIGRALADPREFATSLVAYADRAQLLGEFLASAAALKPSARLLGKVVVAHSRWQLYAP